MCHIIPSTLTPLTPHRLCLLFSSHPTLDVTQGPNNEDEVRCEARAGVIFKLPASFPIMSCPPSQVVSAGTLLLPPSLVPLLAQPDR